ncbi:hypothetical protein [Streptomyces iconiensis]
MAEAAGLSNRSSAHYHLQLLEQRGLVLRTETRRRGYRPA